MAVSECREELHYRDMNTSTGITLSLATTEVVDKTTCRQADTGGARLEATHEIHCYLPRLHNLHFEFCEFVQLYFDELIAMNDSDLSI